MTGGEGEDKITLNAGVAQTVVLQYDRGYDKIVNFSDGTGADLVADKLEVSKAMFGLTGIAGSALPAANWVDDTNGIDSPDALTAQPTFIYEASTGLLWFDADGTGTASAPVAIAGFYGTSVHPHASDIILVA
jgi:Ca2+-binding RTX toxin-like protein